MWYIIGVMDIKTIDRYQHSICLTCPLAFEVYPGYIGCEAGNYPSLTKRRCKFNTKGGKHGSQDRKANV